MIGKRHVEAYAYVAPHINLSDLYMGLFNLYKFIRMYIYVLCIFFTVIVQYNYLLKKKKKSSLIGYSRLAFKPLPVGL